MYLLLGRAPKRSKESAFGVAHRPLCDTSSKALERQRGDESRECGDHDWQKGRVVQSLGTVDRTSDECHLDRAAGLFCSQRNAIPLVPKRTESVAWRTQQVLSGSKGVRGPNGFFRTSCP